MVAIVAVVKRDLPVWLLSPTVTVPVAVVWIGPVRHRSG